MKRILKRIYSYYYTHILKKDLMELQIDLWRKAGIHIGANFKCYSDISMTRDCSLLSIGNNVTVSGGVKFLMHDNATIKASQGEYTDILGRVIIGDNCFIGWGSIILPGVNLARNTIVGAGSVVSKSVNQEGVIIAGNPAKVVGTVESYRQKYHSNMVNLNGMSKEDLEEFVKREPSLLIERKEI